MNEISNKWCAARLVGPDVSVENALEFIRRTEGAFGYPSSYMCNDREFCRKFLDLIGLGEDFATIKRFANAFGHVPLEHLESGWIANSYIHGPNGPVWPTGKVALARNFGKYPSLEEVESDLTAVAENFDWLTFDLGLWDNDKEDAEGEPTHHWRLTEGQWSRVESSSPVKWPAAPDVHSAVMAIAFKPAGARETTWPVEHIDKMWGEQIRAARAIALAA